jgi:hypothetical protein
MSYIPCPYTQISSSLPQGTLSNMDCCISEFQMIQDIIIRLSKYGFSLKFSYLIFLSALMNLKFTNNINVFLAISSISFALLDTYFLNLERNYRLFYKSVVDKRLTGDMSDFFSMSCLTPITSQSLAKTLFSSYIKFFYLSIFSTLWLASLL